MVAACLLVAAAGQPAPAGASSAEAIQTMLQAREFEAIITTYGEEDFSEWTDHIEAAKAFTARGRAHAATGDLESAERDLRQALALGGPASETLLNLAEILQQRGETQDAFEAYEEAYATAAAASLDTPISWLPITATLGAAAILRNRADYEAALEILNRYIPGGSLERVAPVWQARILREYGQVYLGQGEEAAALEAFRLALEAESNAS